MIFSAGATSGANVYAYWNTTNTLSIRFDQEASGNVGVTAAVNRDPSAWYHVVFALDTTQATAANRVKIYINGVQQDTTGSTFPSQNFNTAMNNNVAHSIGRRGYDATSYASFLLAEINHVDGQQLTPSSFGETDSATGVWKPKAYSSTYGTNGFYLKFADNSGTTSTTLGKDYSGNGNNWTPNNFSVTAGAGNDSMVDSPTAYGTDTGVGGEVRGNYCTLNPLRNGGFTLSNGNLDFGGTTSDRQVAGTIALPTSGKWYFEAVPTAIGANSYWGVGIMNTTVTVTSGGLATEGFEGYAATGNKFSGAGNVSYGSTFTTNDVIGVAVDMDNGAIYFAKNNTWQNSGVPTSGASKTGAAFTNLISSGYTWTPAIFSFNTGQSGVTNFGQRPFAYTAPSGFKALCTTNLPTPTIGATSTTQAGKYFNPVLYTGDATVGRSITGVGFAPDFVWAKSRNSGQPHALFDTVRGATNWLRTNTTDAETTNSGVTSFNSDGFTVGASITANGDTITYVAWNWNAGGSNATNTAGTITSTVRANTTSGFSIVTYTGTGANATVGHGLGVAPKFIIFKSRNNVNNWPMWVTAMNDNLGYIFLNLTNAKQQASVYWNSTAPTSSVFSLGTTVDVNGSGLTFVAYCFAPVAGYSAFGSYTGNGSADGPFVYLGFRPRYVLIKYSSGVENWFIADSSRDTYNVAEADLVANSSVAEGTVSAPLDFVSNGFKIRTTATGANASGGTFIYAAFAETPAKFSLAR
jgi:hypothetical protein